MMRRRFLNNIRGNDYHAEYFTIEALEDGLTVSLSQNICEYCIDNEEWITLSADTNTPLVNKGQTLSFKGNLIPNSSHGIGTFTISKRCNLKGNIILMLYGDNFKGQTELRGYDYAFYKLFYNCKNIVDASKLILPATTLANYCYNSMFQSCTSLTTAPELPATTLASYCYNRMFYGCTSLTTAPELPATILTNYCYSQMFRDCTNLNYIKMLATDISANNCLTAWVTGVSSSGKFVKNAAMTSLPRGVNGIPTGWTVVNN